MSEVVNWAVRDTQLYELQCLAQQASLAPSLGNINPHSIDVSFQRILCKLRRIYTQYRIPLGITKFSDHLVTSPNGIVCIDTYLEPYFSQLPNFEHRVLYSDAISDFEIGRIGCMRVFSILDLQDTLGFSSKKYPILIIHKESFSSGLSNNLANLKSQLQSMIRSNFDDFAGEGIVSLKCHVSAKNKVLGQLVLTDLTVHED